MGDTRRHNPGDSGAHPEVPLVGRVAELAVLHEELARAADRSSTSVLVVGEAGVGKSRLVREFTAAAAAGGSRVLTGSCIDLGIGEMPFAPFVEAFRRVARDLGRSAMRDLVGPAYPEIARLVPFLDPNVTASGPEGFTQARMFEAIRWMLDRLSADAPVVLVVEDLHWADQSTLDLLTYLLRSLTEERVLVLLSSRPNETAPRIRALLAELDLRRRVRRLDVPRFTAADLRTFLAAVLGRPPRPDQLSRALELSDGNALFAEELAIAGTLDGDGDGDGAVPLPRSLHDLLAARLDVLGDDARELLQVAAAAGRQVSHRLLRAGCDLPERRLRTALRECVARQVLVVDPTRGMYRFRHALTREAVYQDLLPGDRIQVHGALAAALTADPALSYAGALTLDAELAHHWSHAGDQVASLHASVRAGGAATRLYAFADAVQQYLRALDLWATVPQSDRPEGITRASLFAEAAEAARWAGQASRGVTLVRSAMSEATASGDDDLVPVLTERLGRYLWEVGDAEGSRQAYEQASRLLQGSPPSALATRLLAQRANIAVLAGHYSEGLRLGESAVEMAHAVDAPAEEGRALSTIGVALTMTGQPDEGVRALERALRIADESERLEDVYRAYGNLTFVLENAGRLEESLAVARTGLERSRQLGLERASGSALLRNNLAAVLLLLGRWDEAADAATDALGLGVSAGVAVYPHLVLAEVAIGRGHFAAAEDHLESARRLCERRWEPHLVGPLHACRAELALWDRRPEDAQAVVTEALEAFGDLEEMPLTLRLCSLGLRAAADVAARPAARLDVDRARREEVRAVAQGVAARVATATAAFGGRALLPETAALAQLCSAELDRLAGTAGPAQWADVAAAWESLRRPHPTGYARWRQAEAALATGGATGGAAAALAPARQAHRAALELAAGPLLREVTALARRGRLAVPAPPSPAPPPAPEVTDPFRLSEREREVLAQLCAGRRNREIAAALFIAEGTVRVHVSNVLTKLGVSSRNEAAAVAHRLGLALPELPGD